MPGGAEIADRAGGDVEAGSWRIRAWGLHRALRGRGELGHAVVDAEAALAWRFYGKQDGSASKKASRADSRLLRSRGLRRPPNTAMGFF